jgi:hypothetical protein
VSENLDSILPSRRAWPRFGTQRDVWIPCPLAFREGDDEASWAHRFAARWWAKSGVEYSESQVAALAEILSDLRGATFRPGLCCVAVIRLPPALGEPPKVQEPLPVGIGVWEQGGDRDSRLRLLANAVDPDAIEPPIIEEFGNDALGTGLKTLRYGHLADGSLFAAVNYAFRSEEYETDLRFSASCADLNRVQAAMPDIDELVRTTSLGPWDEP